MGDGRDPDDRRGDHRRLDTGWTFYTPYSTTTNTNVIKTSFGVFILGFSSILTGLNFIVTIHKLRAPGMPWFRMPRMLWSVYATALIQLLATPVLAITLLLLIFERAFHIGIFDPKLGGDPVLFQHFFWFYSHPAVYIMILPAMAVISEVVCAFSHKNILEFYESRLKAVSFLPLTDHQYTQAPYQTISPAEFIATSSLLSPVDWHIAKHDQMDVLCDGEACLLTT